MIKRPYTSASNRARRISEGRSAAKAKWEADQCSKHFSDRVKGRTGTKRPVPMTRLKSLATRFYRLKCGHAPRESTSNVSATEKTTNAGGAAAEAGRPGGGNTSSATSAGGETSNRHYGRRWEMLWAGMRADADMCKSLSCFAWKSATKR